jgi:hypothetical protein
LLPLYTRSMQQQSAAAECNLCTRARTYHAKYGGTITFFAQICDQPVWYMPPKMVNGLRVTTSKILAAADARAESAQAIRGAGPTVAAGAEEMC